MFRPCNVFLHPISERIRFFELAGYQYRQDGCSVQHEDGPPAHHVREPLQRRPLPRSQ